MIALRGPRCRGRLAGGQRGGAELRRRGRHAHGARPGLSERIRASFLLAGLAGPLRARRDAAAGRRRDRPSAPGSAPGRLPGDGGPDRGGSRHRARARRTARGRGVHGRALGHGDRERADGGGAHAGDHAAGQRRLRAPRAGPGAPAGQDGRRHPGIGPNVLTVDGAERLGAASTTSHPGPHRDRLVHGPGRSDRRRCGSRTPCPATCG